MSISTKRVITAVIAVALFAGVWAATVAIANATTKEFTADFESTVGLFPGSDVQMLGVAVGKVTKVEPQGATVRVTMKLDRGYKAAASTGAVIVAPTLVSDRFVQLTEPHVSGPELASGTNLGLDRTAVPVEIDQLYASLTDIATKLGPDGANSAGALSDLLTVAAENLDGNGEAINETLKEFGKATATLADSDEAFFGTIANLKEFNDMLVENDSELAQLNRQLDVVAGFLADDRDEMASAITELAAAMAVLDDFLADNRQNLQTSVENLVGPTQTLVDQQESLEEAVRLIPLALQNFIRAYNPETNTLDGRGNLNELSIWSTDGLSGSTSGNAPPVLFPGSEGGQ